ncbi:MAG: flagellar motor switch protein FliN [Rickettsiales bacterium]
MPDDDDITMESALREEHIDLGAISDIPVEVTAILGSASMPVSRLLKLSRGSVVRLDRKVGEPVDITVNNRLIARGEIVIVENRIGITMTEIIAGQKAGS